MPTRIAHEQQAHSNNSFWMTLNIQQTPHLDWVVTGMFYEAVHWIEAFLATRNIHSSSHGERSQRMASIQELANSTAIIDYGILRTESENARYWCYNFTPAQVTSDLVPTASRIQKTLQALLNP